MASWCYKSLINLFWEIGAVRNDTLLEKTVMSKEKKGNKEAKKPKAPSAETKKQKKDPKRYDGKP